MKYSIGKNPNSRKKRKFYVNDNYFAKQTSESCYWAGFIAADGCIIEKNNNNKSLSLALQKRDLNHLSKFCEDIEYDGTVRIYRSHGYDTCGIQINSIKIVDDLRSNFNITPRKSLTLQPPQIEDYINKLSFIIGYIDGDGTIGMYPDSRNGVLRLQVSCVGTKSILDWILETTNTINSIYKKSKIYRFSLSDKKARDFILPMISINVPKLGRKWEKAVDGSNFINSKVKLTDNNIDEIKLLYFKEGLKQKDIAKIYNVHQVTISEVILGNRIKSGYTILKSKEAGDIDIEEAQDEYN